MFVAEAGRPAGSRRRAGDDDPGMRTKWRLAADSANRCARTVAAKVTQSRTRAASVIVADFVGVI
jgi:hypothetical protein